MRRRRRDGSRSVWPSVCRPPSRRPALRRSRRSTSYRAPRPTAGQVGAAAARFGGCRRRRHFSRSRSRSWRMACTSSRCRTSARACSTATPSDSEMSLRPRPRCSGLRRVSCGVRRIQCVTCACARHTRACSRRSTSHACHPRSTSSTPPAAPPARRTRCRFRSVSFSCTIIRSSGRSTRCSDGCARWQSSWASCTSERRSTSAAAVSPTFASAYSLHWHVLAVAAGQLGARRRRRRRRGCARSARSCWRRDASATRTSVPSGCSRGACCSFGNC